jgi:ribosomal protein S18 acetylase RimI-like enzyme
MSTAIRIERIAHPDVSDEDFRQLAELLVDAVDSGAAVSFMAPLHRARAEGWWRKTFPGSLLRAIFLVARDADGIAGTVQMQPSWATNQPHRGEICKLIVHRRARGAGLGERLMRAIEVASRDAGFSLLTLDAKEGGAAVQLYRKLGWTEVGTIPDFALDPDGKAKHGTVIFYKRLGGE